MTHFMKSAYIQQVSDNVIYSLVTCSFRHSLLTALFLKFLSLWSCLSWEGLSSTPTHCSFRDKATNGTKPCFCQLTIHWGLLNLRSVFSSADRGWHLSLATQLKLGGWTVALSWIIQKNVFEFNSSPTPPQTESITPSFRITVLACTYLCYCADHIVLYCITIIYLHVFLSSWTRDSFMMRTVYIFFVPTPSTRPVLSVSPQPVC